MVDMKRTAVIFCFLGFILSSCTLFGNHVVYRDIAVSNNDTVERTVVFTPTKDNRTGGKLTVSVSPGSKKITSVTGLYDAASENIHRYTVTETVKDTFVIEPVKPVTTTYTIMNHLSVSVTLKDRTYPSWTATVTAGSSLSKDAQLYSDEAHGWYIDGEQKDNASTYIMNGANKVFFTVSVSDSQIIISPRQ